MNIKTIFITVCLFSLITNHVVAQQKFALEIGSGIMSGSWSDRTKSQNGDLYNVEYNSFASKISAPVKLALYYTLSDKVHLGVEVKNQYIITDNTNPSPIIDGINTRFNTPIVNNSTKTIRINEGFSIYSYFATLKFFITNKERFKLAPIIGFGSFYDKGISKLETSQKAMWAYKIALQMETHSNNLYLYLTPQLDHNKFVNKDDSSLAPVEFRTTEVIITSIGIELGVGFKFPN